MGLVGRPSSPRRARGHRWPGSWPTSPPRAMLATDFSCSPPTPLASACPSGPSPDSPCSCPKSGPWMNAVKSVFGIALVVAGLYYLRPIVPALAQLTARHDLFLVATFVSRGRGAAVRRRAPVIFRGQRAKPRAKPSASCSPFAGIFGFINYLLTPEIHIEWLRSEPDAVAAARAQGKPLLVDFMADWCLPCQEMDVKVFGRPDVAPTLADFVLLPPSTRRRPHAQMSLSACPANHRPTSPSARPITSRSPALARARTSARPCLSTCTWFTAPCPSWPSPTSTSAPRSSATSSPRPFSSPA
jgi:hypothetical protein